MIQCVIVADDLTGANASASLLKKVGLKVASLMVLDKLASVDLGKLDAIACSTDSRGISSQDAYNRVLAATKLFKDHQALVYNKRVDSTLRGNLGSEIDAMLDGLGDGRVAIVVPSFPDSNRIAVQGMLFVEGTLLEYSDAAKDPKTPVDTSVIQGLIEKTTRRKVTTIYIQDVAKGEAYLAEKLTQAAKDHDIIILDAVRNRDLDTIAKALISTPLKYIAVDPGPFTKHLCSLLVVEEAKDEKKILLSIGSVTETTRKQLKQLNGSRRVYFSYIDAGKLIDQTKRDDEIKRVIQDIKTSATDYNRICITSTVLEGDCKLPLDQIAQASGQDIEGISKMISTGIAAITKELIVQDFGFEGVISSGGDITVALCEAIGAIGIEIEEEVVPLVAYGTLIGGEKDKFKIITKGGMIGGKDCFTLCIDRMKKDI